MRPAFRDDDALPAVRRALRALCLPLGRLGVMLAARLVRSAQRSRLLHGTQKALMLCVRCLDMASPARTHRLDMRVTETQDAVIREAAALAGQTVTAFLLTAAQDRARELLDERRHLVMGDRAFAGLVAALEDPGKPVPELVKLFALPRIAEQ
ncbi:MAG: hypothetical protein QOJ46_1649 [bacterium]